MSRGLTMLLLCSFVATIIAFFVMVFIAEPFMSFFVGNTIAKFIALWALIALVIKFDDAVILPIASKVVTMFGLDGVVRKK